jgi:hypothetical protein
MFTIFNTFTIVSLKTLNVKKSNGVENDAITNILQKCSQLVKLDISHCQNVTKSIEIM